MRRIKSEESVIKPDKETVLFLAKQAAEGDASAREKLILMHLPLVEILVSKYINPGLDWDDLYQEGCYGLIIAIDRFDYTRNIRLDTYATHWIEGYIRRATIQQNPMKPIAPKENLYYSLSKYCGAYSDLCIKLNRQPSYKEIADRIGIDEAKTRKLSLYLYFFYSLNTIVSDDLDKEVPLIDTFKVPLGVTNSAEDEYFRREMSDFNPENWGVALTKRERMVVSRHLGFTPSGYPERYAEISADTGWSMETLRRDFIVAIDKFRQKFSDLQDILPYI